MQYDWPGNVRELENCVERAVALGNGQVIDLGDLPPSIASGSLDPVHAAWIMLRETRGAGS